LWHRTETPGLPNALQDLLVLDLEFGVVSGLVADLQAEGVVLAGIGRDIGQDGHLVDVGIVFRIYIFEFGMKRGVAGAGQSGESLVDLYIRITFMKAGVVILARHP
jgi:hypothetical protein